MPDAAGAHRVTVWLDWYPNTDQAGMYVALAKGYYAAAGLDVVPQVPSGAAERGDGVVPRVG
jgi:ABC-type nitrate/sulfonate/bicarbonate transport system substrate-binding protein